MLLKLTREASLALAVLHALTHEQRRSAAELAETVGSTPAHLSQVVGPIQHAGWVESSFGPGGGYQLTPAASDVTLLDVIEAVQGPVRSDTCVMCGPCTGAGSVSDREVAEARRRVCDLGFLRTPSKKPDGSVGYRCPSEPTADYVREGRREEDTVGRTCLCNGLLATAGPGQVRGTGTEPPLVTAGDDVVRVVHALARDGQAWSAGDVVSYLLSGVA